MKKQRPFPYSTISAIIVILALLVALIAAICNQLTCEIIQKAMMRW